MSEIVIGVGASHTTLMNTRWDEVAGLDRAVSYRDALAAAREWIIASGADAAVVVGPNHFRGFWLDLMPAFTVGVGDVIGAGEHGTPSGPQATDPKLAQAILEGLFAAGFEPAFSAHLEVDHGITHAIQYVLPEGLPVVPLVVNCFAPPMPPVARCVALGTALRHLLMADGLGRRVAVIGSGGLSHQLPFPDWRAPQSDDDAFLVESWIHGRGRWTEFEPRRRAIVTSARPRLDEGFDTDVLARLEAGTLAALTDLTDADLEAAGGNGAHELRNWMVMAASCAWAEGEVLAYAPMPEWLTGMAVAVIDTSCQNA